MLIAIPRLHVKQRNISLSFDGSCDSKKRTEPEMSEWRGYRTVGRVILRWMMQRGPV
jgi:hypothetical protein